MKNDIRWVTFCLLTSAIVALWACNGGPSPETRTGSIRIDLQWHENTRQSSGYDRREVDCADIGIDWVKAVVLSNPESDIVGKGGPWRCTRHNGKIDGIPPGQDLTVEVSALDADGRVKYFGRGLHVEIRANDTAQVAVVLAPMRPTPEISLVQDIDNGPGGSYPHNLTPSEGRLFFVARQPDIHFELFATDGTAEGTRLVRDIYTRPLSTLNPGPPPEPAWLTACNGLLYFLADDGYNGPGLWQTDGTGDQTRMTAGFGDTGMVDPSHLFHLNGTLFFTAGHADSGRELWQSDGSVSGSRPVRDLFPGTAGSHPHEQAVMGNWLYFVAHDGRRGHEIWRTNGSTTDLVLDIADDAVPDTTDQTQDSYASDLTVVNGRLFCRAVNRTYGEELWMITADDTSVRADLVADLNAHSGKSCRPRSLAAIGDTYLAFAAARTDIDETESAFGIEPWLYDWTMDDEPVMIADINPGGAGSHPGNFVSINGVLYFTASDDLNQEHLWAWPIGSAEAPNCLTTTMVDPAPRFLTVFDGQLYFSAYEDGTGRELWTADGTGVMRVADLCSGPCSSSPSEMTVMGEDLYFAACGTGIGKELFRLRHAYPLSSN